MFYISEEAFNSNLDKRINKDIRDLEIVNLKSCKEYPGFYHVPILTDLVISKNLEVISLTTGKILNRYTHKWRNNYYCVKVGHDIKDKNGNYKTKRYLLSRVIALTFIGRPTRHLDKNYNKLQVNHIDGNSRNNTLINLEWCSNIENAHHARLHLYSSQEKAVMAKNITNGYITIFKTATLCAKHFNIPKSTFCYHLKSKHIDKGIKDNHIFKYLDDTEWPVVDYDNLFEISKGSYEASKRRVLAKNLITNEVKEFNSITECSIYFSLKIETLAANMRLKNIKGHKDNWIFKYKDSKDWPIINIENLYEIGNYIKPTPVSYNGKDYNSIQQMAIDLNIAKTTLYRIIKRKDYASIPRFIKENT